VDTDHGATGVLFVDVAHFGPVAIRRTAFHHAGQFAATTCPSACAHATLHDLSRRMWQQRFQVPCPTLIRLVRSGRVGESGAR
jgi:hypothetical protein